MVEHQALDLGGIRVEPADDEHVLDAVGDGDVVVGVDVADVAGVEPAVGVDGLGGRGRVVEVADHHLEAARHDLTRVAGRHVVAVGVDDLHLDAGDRAPRRVGDDLGVVVVPAHAHDAGGLGEPVAGDHALEAELLAHLHHELDGDDGRAGDRQAQRREVVLGQVGVEDGLVDRRWPREHRDPFLLHRRHHRRRVEHEVGEQRGAGEQRRDQARLQPHGVEQRVHEEVAVAVAESDDVGPRRVRAHAGAVAQHRALRGAGRARREDDVAHRVAVERRSRASTSPSSTPAPRARKSAQLIVPAGTAPSRITISSTRSRAPASSSSAT